MLGKSIDAALLALRKQTIRGDGLGLKHVEALLRLRQVPIPRVYPPRVADAARRNQMRWLVLEALRDGPKGMAELAAHVAARRPALTHAAAHYRTGQTIQRLKTAGLIVRKDRMGRWVWGLAVEMPPTQNFSSPPRSVVAERT